MRILFCTVLYLGVVSCSGSEFETDTPSEATEAASPSPTPAPAPTDPPTPSPSPRHTTPRECSTPETIPAADLLPLFDEGTPVNPGVIVRWDLAPGWGLVAL